MFCWRCGNMLVSYPRGGWVAGLSPFNVINFFVTEFAEFRENHLGKTPLAFFKYFFCKNLMYYHWAFQLNLVKSSSLIKPLHPGLLSYWSSGRKVNNFCTETQVNKWTTETIATQGYFVYYVSSWSIKITIIISHISNFFFNNVSR